MELELVSHLCSRFPDHPQMKLGPGDDAAILELAGSRPEIVVSTDLLTEGVDFLLARMNPRKIGRKALAANLSDLAAMAAKPLACVISVALPKRPVFPNLSDLPADEIFLRKGRKAHGNSLPELMELLCEGFLDAVSEIPIAIAGGDTNSWDGPLVLSVTVLGEVAGKPLCRHEAKPGDAILVTGPLGGSILRHQFECMPRTAEMLRLNEVFHLHSGMDISDGLTLDLSRLCHRSRCGAELFLDEIPISDDARELSELKPEKSKIYDWIPAGFASGSPLDHALGDGEDFEVLFTTEWEESEKILQNTLGIPVWRIGRITEAEGIYGLQENGTRQLLPIRGFEHS